MALVENRFGGNGLYILDEPEAALSPILLFFVRSKIAKFYDFNVGKIRMSSIYKGLVRLQK